MNEELARGYRDAVARIAETLGLESGLNAFSLARFPDVLTVERRELDKDKAAAALSEITAKAVEEFNAMREREGERLRQGTCSESSKPLRGLFPLWRSDPRRR